MKLNHIDFDIIHKLHYLMNNFNNLLLYMVYKLLVNLHHIALNILYTVFYREGNFNNEIQHILGMNLLLSLHPNHGSNFSKMYDLQNIMYTHLCYNFGNLALCRLLILDLMNIEILFILLNINTYTERERNLLM